MMLDVVEFAGVVGVILVAMLGWRWGTFYIKRIQGETREEIADLEDRIELLEGALEREKVARLPAQPDSPVDPTDA